MSISTATQLKVQRPAYGRLGTTASEVILKVANLQFNEAEFSEVTLSSVAAEQLLGSPNRFELDPWALPFDERQALLALDDLIDEDLESALFLLGIPAKQLDRILFLQQQVAGPCPSNAPLDVVLKMCLAEWAEAFRLAGY